jgi:hypothetical protein
MSRLRRRCRGRTSLKRQQATASMSTTGCGMTLDRHPRCSAMRLRRMLIARRGSRLSMTRSGSCSPRSSVAFRRPMTPCRCASMATSTAPVSSWAVSTTVRGPTAPQWRPGRTPRRCSENGRGRRQQRRPLRPRRQPTCTPACATTARRRSWPQQLLIGW